MVNTLKDYKEFSGVLMPTVLTFDVVGRERPDEARGRKCRTARRAADSLFRNLTSESNRPRSRTVC